MQELNQLVRALANLLNLICLFDRVEIVPHMAHAASRGRDDVVEAGEIAHEQRFRSSAFGIETAVGHRLAAAGLVKGIADLVAEALEQLEGCDANLGEEGVDVTGYEQTDAHASSVQ